MSKAKNSENLPAVLVPQEYSIMQMPESDLKEIIEANLGGDSITQFDLDRVGIPAGGGTSWVIPTLEGEEETKVVEGIIVHFTTPRAYWETPFEEGGGGPPDCSSDDGVVGFGDPGGDCQTCPLAQFGSGRNGRSQACSQMRCLFVIRPDSLLPLVVVLPAMSLQPAKKYFLRLASQAKPYYGVVTRIELERDKNQDNITYSKAKFSVAGMLSKDEQEAIKRIADSMRPAFEAVRVNVEHAYDGSQRGGFDEGPDEE